MKVIDVPKLFESFDLLFENKIEYLANQYHDKLLQRAKNDHRITTDDPQAIVQELSKMATNGKYLHWIVREYVNGYFLAEDVSQVKEVLEQFHKRKQQLNQKDINQYNFQELEDLMDSMKEQETPTSKRQQAQKIKTEGAKVVAQDASGTIVQLLTEEAANYYGKGTKWCTTADNDNMFEFYSQKGPLYVLLGSDDRKYQFQFESNEFKNEKNRDVDINELSDKYSVFDQFLDQAVDKAFKEKDGEGIIGFIDLDIISQTDKRLLDTEILKKVHHLGKTLAHVMARKGYEFTDPEILKLSDKCNISVAHVMARYGHKFTDPKILKLANYSGITVAHLMARNGHEFTDPEILKLADEDGYTVAHEMARKGHKFTDSEILKLANDAGVTVVHTMALSGHKFTDPEILKLATNYDVTVAHIMARMGYHFTDPEILKLSDDSDTTVKDIMNKSK